MDSKHLASNQFHGSDESVLLSLNVHSAWQEISLLMSKTLDFLKSNASVETLTLEELKAAEAAQQG